MELSWHDDDLSEILTGSHTVAVVGLSNDRFRPSHGVARYLQEEGYRIIPVNPKEQE
ncbi:MAG: CoA-binding protein, partial [Chloroflexota bacterium]